MVKVTGAFQKSTEIMKTTNQLMKLPQLSATMREMSMEMMKVRLGVVEPDLVEWHYGGNDGRDDGWPR